MHIEISKLNPIYKAFDDERKRQGFTTFKSAVLSAMMLFLKSAKTTEVTETKYEPNELKHEPPTLEELEKIKDEPVKKGLEWLSEKES